jgi:hypothetical protein
MAYVFDLDTELSAVFVDNLGTSIVEFSIGYDPEADEIFLFSITLGPSDGEASDLRFGIRTRHAVKEWRISGLDFSRERVVACVPAGARKNVLALLLAAVQALVQGCADEKITMETYYPNLPPRGLEKYEMITKILEINGFSIETKFRDADGIDYWLYTKNRKTT